MRTTTDRRRRWVLAAIVVAVSLLAGGGIVGYAAYRDHQKQVAARNAQAATERAAAQAAAVRRRREAEAERKAAEAVAACHTMFDPLVAALADLQGAIDVGLTYTEHRQALARAAGIYMRLGVGGADPACIVNVGAPLEDALNAYRRANEYWRQSLASFSAPLESMLEVDWDDAAQALSKAEAGFKKVGVPADQGADSGRAS